MAYVNVAEWKTGQVCEWLKGVDSSVLSYVHSFMNHNVNGQQLLNLRPEDLEQLGVLKLGHQEIILEAVEYLRNFHYELDRENLQLLALRLSCQAFSLHNELFRQTDSRPVTTQTLADVASVMTAVKPLVHWLDRPPFSGQLEYNDRKAKLLKLSLEMATCAQRDRFAEKPVEEIRMTCEQLAKLSDYIIQDIADPMILQPASLDLATLKKKPGDDLGFYILPSFHGAHQIAEIKFGSTAHQCGKMEEGDEIVQVNYQTVVGWERKHVLELFRECPNEVLLTLKRRPRHTKVYGQIYIKPYRLPSNKKTPYTTRWQHNLPSPRPELLTIPDFTMPISRHVPKDPSPEPTSILDTVNMLDTMATDSSDSDSEIEPPSSVRLYSAKPRNLVQRRATITGASSTIKYDIDIEQFWKELKQEHNTTFQLRDKAASCALGLDTVPSSLRPQTCLGIEQTKRKKKVSGQMDEIETVHVNESYKLDKSSEQIQKSKLELQKNTDYCQNSVMDVDINISNNMNNNRVPLQTCNDDNDTKINESNVHRKERSKLDKSYSTPAYDLTENDFVERKLATIENHSKLSLISSGSGNASSNSLYKTDFCVNNDEEGVTTRSEDIHQSNIGNLEVVGNVAQKINIIEKSLRYADIEGKMYSSKVPEQMNLVRDIVHIKINNIDYNTSIEKNQSNIECMHRHFDNVNYSCVYGENYVSNNENNENETRKSNIINNSLANNSGLAYESNEEKSESTSSYNKCTGSSSDGDATMNKFGDILETFNYAMIERTKFIQEGGASSKLVVHSITNENDPYLENVWTPVIDTNAISDTSNFDIQKTYSCTNLSKTMQMTEADMQTYMQIQNSGTRNLNRDTDTDVSPQFCQHSEISKAEQIKKPEIKSRSALPDAPPRKYFTKPAPLNLSSISNSLDDQKIPKVSERPCIKKDLKKSELLVEKCGRVHCLKSYKNDHIETYHDFIEKSTNFIDEPSIPISELKLTPLTDPYGYSEIYEEQFKEENILLYGKREMYNERIRNVNHLPHEQNRTEHGLNNMDSSDGVGCSRQVKSPDLKCKTLEKDKCAEKSVVNRAIMVARSIGLHGSSSKPSVYSPRSSRKRNMLLAKRRNVSVKEMGAGDLAGWLTYRSRGAGGAWARAWFVLKGSSLYKFKAQDSLKADCLIALTGFTVSQASEVKSRKYAFKVYHTGTVFYFAATTDDSLAVWLDAINKATLGTDSYQTSGLFSETDESDVESKMKVKDVQTPDCKLSSEKLTFGSLKKTRRKDFGCKDHEMGGASLDRKYLKFLGARNQNVPVPTAQFRSYRRVLPTSTLTRKQTLIPHSPDLQVTVAGSTFYGLNASYSATDVPNSHDMSDYRRTTDRCHSSHGRRSADFQGFITLEEFMLSSQEKDHRQALGNKSASINITPLTNDHVQRRNFDDYGTTYAHTKHFDDVLPNNGIIYGQAKNWDETLSTINSTSYGFSRNIDEVHTQNQSTDIHHVESEINNQNEQGSEHTEQKSFNKSRQLIYGYRKPLELSCVCKSKPQETIVYYSVQQTDPIHGQNLLSETTYDRDRSDSKHDGRQYVVRGKNKQIEIVCPCSAQIYKANNQSRNDYEYTRRSNENDQTRESDISDIIVGLHSVSRKFIRNENYSGSSSNLASHTSSEILQRARKEASVTRKRSFNLTDHCCDHLSSDKRWMDSLRRIDKKNCNFDKNRLKNVAQYQPPPIPNSPFDQDGMRPAFEMHLDKSEHIQKTNRLKSLFSSKSPQKPNTLDLSKEHQKTLLGSPRLHRALFRDKRSNQQHQHSSQSNSRSPGDSSISQSLSSFSGTSQFQTYNQSFSSASSISDWSPDTPMSNITKCAMGHAACHTRLSNFSRNSLTPPILPHIPPPTSPPPDYPGLEYPPVFEPGTYSLSDASLLGNRNKNSQTKDEQ